MSTMNCSLLSLGCIFGFTAPANQGAMTALRGLRIAQRRLRPEVRAKLLSATSCRSDQTLVPNAWRFVFLDPATNGNCRVVTVAAKTSSEHPDTVEAFNSAKAEERISSHVIPQNKLLVDSDKALAQIRAASKLKGVRSAQYLLIQAKGASEPVWSIQFLAEDDTRLCKFQIGTKTGAMEHTPSRGK